MVWPMKNTKEGKKKKKAKREPPPQKSKKQWEVEKAKQQQDHDFNPARVSTKIPLAIYGMDVDIQEEMSRLKFR